MTTAHALTVAFLALLLALPPRADAKAALFDPEDMVQHTWSADDTVDLTVRKPAPKTAPPATPAPMPQSTAGQDIAPAPQAQPSMAVTPVPLSNGQGETPPPSSDNSVAYVTGGGSGVPYLAPIPLTPAPQRNQPPATSTSMAAPSDPYSAPGDPYLVSSPVIGPPVTDAPESKTTFTSKVGTWVKGRFEMPNPNPVNRPDLPRTTAVTGRPPSR